MTRDELIREIRSSFKDVKLEDGVGLWEGQGLDDYADESTILELRRKEERNTWDHIPYEDLVYCQSSLSFFDAKGMRFCLPKFLIFDLLAEEILREQDISAPDVLFILGYKLNDEYQKTRFSLLNSQQITTIIHYLEYKIEETIFTNEEYLADYYYTELVRTLDEWKQKLS